MKQFVITIQVYGFKYWLQVKDHWEYGWTGIKNNASLLGDSEARSRMSELIRKNNLITYNKEEIRSSIK